MGASIVRVAVGTAGDMDVASMVLGSRVLFVTTETASPDIILEALAVIDQALPTMQHRELVSSDEVADLLLDLRLLLATSPSEEADAVL